MEPITVSSYLAMGGYGAFIWSAYGLVCLVMVALTIQSLVARRRVHGLLSQIEPEGDDR